MTVSDGDSSTSPVTLSILVIFSISSPKKLTRVMTFSYGGIISTKSPRALKVERPSSRSFLVYCEETSIRSRSSLSSVSPTFRVIAPLK